MSDVQVLSSDGEEKPATNWDESWIERDEQGRIVKHHGKLMLGGGRKAGSRKEHIAEFSRNHPPGQASELINEAIGIAINKKDGYLFLKAAEMILLYTVGKPNSTTLELRADVSDKLSAWLNGGQETDKE